MHKPNSFKINLLYNFLLNFINFTFPLITLPYVTRVLGVDNIGKYTFSLSFSSWFLIFATFGTTTYGIREIARVRNNKHLLSETFSAIFFINLVMTIIALTTYIAVIIICPKTNTEILLFLVFALLIFLNLFNIDWLYMGLENFKVITFRSLVVKLISLGCIFTFIQQQSDYITYALIGVLSLGFANVINFIYSRRFVEFTLKNLNIKSHIKKLSIFFYSNLVISMYNLFDQVLLGFLSTDRDVAFYSISKQIYAVALSITMSISTVLLPTMAYLSRNDFESYKTILEKSINYIYFFSVPLVFGIIVLAKDIIWFFGGYEFENAYIALIILSSLIFTVSLGSWQYSQLFVPTGREKIGLRAQLIMALISLGANIIFIPTYGYIGASISLVLAEITGTLYGVYYTKNKIQEIKINYISNSIVRYLLASLVMLVIILCFKFMKFEHIANLTIGVVIGLVAYLGVLYLIKDEICREFIDYLKLKFYSNAR